MAGLRSVRPWRLDRERSSTRRRNCGGRDSLAPPHTKASEATRLRHPQRTERNAAQVASAQAQAAGFAAQAIHSPRRSRKGAMEFVRASRSKFDSLRSRFTRGEAIGSERGNALTALVAVWPRRIASRERARFARQNSALPLKTRAPDQIIETLRSPCREVSRRFSFS